VGRAGAAEGVSASGERGGMLESADWWLSALRGPWMLIDGAAENGVRPSNEYSGPGPGCGCQASGVRWASGGVAVMAAVAGEYRAGGEGAAANGVLPARWASQ